MLVCSVQPYYRYSGYSTDEKPTHGVVDGSTFHEINPATNQIEKEFEWRKDNWYLKILQPVTAVISNFPSVYPTTSIEEAQIVYEDGDVLYVCRAAIGTVKTAPSWKIKKVNGMDITWCGGNQNYDNVATSLEIVKNLSYS